MSDSLRAMLAELKIDRVQINRTLMMLANDIQAAYKLVRLADSKSELDRARMEYYDYCTIAALLQFIDTEIAKDAD